MTERTDVRRVDTSAACAPRSPLALAEGLIDDNAKRSVSVRINTSDYGRIRIVARRLRVREAEVFRYLLQVGLIRIAPLLAERLDAQRYLWALAELGPDLGTTLGFDAREFASLLRGFKHDALPVVSDEDLELVDLAGSHPRLLLDRLALDVADNPEPRAALLGHLRERYLAKSS